MKTGVLLMAHGSPDRLDEMGDYLRHVMTRRPPTPEFIAEMTERYDMMTLQITENSSIARMQAMVSLIQSTDANASAVRIAYKNADMASESREDQHIEAMAQIANDRRALEIQARDAGMVDTTNFLTN